MMTPSARRFIQRALILIGSVAVITPLSWKAGELFARRRAEAARQVQFEDTRRLMEEQRDYLRAGAVFPDFALISSDDSSTTSLYDQLQGGGMLIFVAPECPSCEAIVDIVRGALARVTDQRRLCVVSSAPIERIREWNGRHAPMFRCYQDRDGFIPADYEFTVIPFLVLLNDQFEIVDYDTGAWSESDYVRLLTRK